jgi:hypothetical protein
VLETDIASFEVCEELVWVRTRFGTGDAITGRVWRGRLLDTIV